MKAINFTRSIGDNMTIGKLQAGQLSQPQEPQNPTGYHSDDRKAKNVGDSGGRRVCESLPDSSHTIVTINSEEEEQTSPEGSCAVTDRMVIRSPVVVRSYKNPITDYALKAISSTGASVKENAGNLFSYPGKSLGLAHEGLQNKAAQMWQDYLKAREEGSATYLQAAGTFTGVALAKATSAITTHIAQSVVDGLTNPMAALTHLYFMGYPTIPGEYWEARKAETAGKMAFTPMPSEKPVSYEGFIEKKTKYHMLGLYYKTLGF